MRQPDSKALESPSTLQCGRRIWVVMKMRHEDKEKGPVGLISRGTGLNYVVCQCIHTSFLVPSFFPNHMYKDIN